MGEEFMNIEKVKELAENYRKKIENNKFNLNAFGDQDESYKLSIGNLLTENEIILELLEKQVPMKVIKIPGKSSQACPMCEHNVKWNYCSNCGQKIQY